MQTQIEELPFTTKSTVWSRCWTKITKKDSDNADSDDDGRDAVHDPYQDDDEEPLRLNTRSLHRDWFDIDDTHILSRPRVTDSAWNKPLLHQQQPPQHQQQQQQQQQQPQQQQQQHQTGGTLPTYLPTYLPTSTRNRHPTRLPPPR